jgi:chromosome segregation ATPase
MDTNTLLQTLGTTALSGAVFWWLGSTLRAAKMQPLIDAQASAAKLAEQKLAEEKAEHADDVKVVEAALAEHKAQFEATLASSARTNAEVKAELASYREQVEGATRVQADRFAELERTIVEKEHQLALAAEKAAPLQQRITDIEGTLSAERGKMAALETAVQAKEELAKQFSSELENVRQTAARDRQQAQEKEAGMRSSLAEFEKWQAAGLSQSEVMGQELERCKAALATAEADSESKQADLKRKLGQAETKVQMLQKEIMAIVSSGGAGDAAAAATAAEDLEKALERARTAERKLAEMGSNESDSELRKKLRSSEYRVCELEFKLAEVEESRDKALAGAGAGSASEQPSAEYLAKLHEELATAKKLCEQLTTERDAARSA